MNKIINRDAWILRLLCLCLLIPTLAWAGPEAEYKKLSKSYTLHADNSQEFRRVMELTLLTHTAMNSTYGETFIVYDPKMQELRINEAYTRQKDGKIVRLPDNALVEVLPSAAADAPAFNHLKEMVVVHTGLELGATIVLDYSILTRPSETREPLEIYEPLPQSSPVKEFTLTVNYPKDVPFIYSIANEADNHREQTDNGAQTLTWTWRDLPAASREPNVAVRNGDQPYFMGTTAPSISTTLQPLQEQYKRLYGEGNPVIASISESLIEEQENEAGEIRAILDYVYGLDEVAVSLAMSRYNCRPIDQIISSAYGTNLEKSFLLAALLNEAGFNAEPIIAFQTKAEQGLCRPAIEQVATFCQWGDQSLLLSSNSYERPNIDPEYQTLYSLTTGQPIEIPAFQDCRIEGEIAITLLTGEQPQASATYHVGNDLLPYLTDKEENITFQPAWQAAGEFNVLTLPEAPLGVVNLGYGRLNSQRKTNLLLPRAIDERYVTTVTYPEGLSLQTPSLEKQVDNTVGELTIRISRHGNQAYVERRLVIRQRLIMPRHYGDFHQLMAEWENEASRSLVFRRTETNP